MDAGWIKLHRKSKKSAVLQDAVCWQVWCHLLMDANIEDRQVLDGRIIRRGEVLIGQAKYAAEIGITRQKLRTALRRLEKLGNINQQSNQHGTVVTICNYSTYQDSTEQANQQSNQRLTNAQPTPNQHLTNAQPQDKKERSKEVKKGRRNRGFAPPSIGEVSDYCQKRGNSIDPSQFVDYYAARGWKLKGGQTMKNWRAAVRTWERNEVAKSKYQPIPEDF